MTYKVLHVAAGRAELECLNCGTVSPAELDEDGVPCFDCPECNPEYHACIEHVEFHEADSTEPHGEVFHDQWWECSLCHTRYTEQELEAHNAE